jgi:hypothetical protein
MLLKVCAIFAGFGALYSAAAATDYIFASSFETIACNGAGCTYCNPANPKQLCGSDSHCSPQPDSTSVCSYPAGAGTSGAACSALAECAGPFTCINSGSSATCQNWCAIPGGSCPGVQSCYALNPSVSTGTTEWGICL